MKTRDKSAAISEHGTTKHPRFDGEDQTEVYSGIPPFAPTTVQRRPVTEGSESPTSRYSGNSLSNVVPFVRKDMMPPPLVRAPKPSLAPPFSRPLLAKKSQPMIAEAPGMSAFVEPPQMSALPEAHEAPALPSPPQIHPETVTPLRRSTAIPASSPAANDELGVFSHDLQGSSPQLHTPWAEFEKIGLGAPKAAPFNRAKFIVSAYRSLGFAILSIIVVVLVGYIASNVFYATSDRWIQPTVISPTDEKVMMLSSQAATQENERDRIAAELAQTELVIESQQSYQTQFAQAIKSDLAARRLTLGRIRELASEYAGARARTKRSNQAYANESKQRMNQEFAAGLIDRSDMLSGKYQIAQIQTTSLSLAERQTEYETRSKQLEVESSALDAILSGQTDGTAISYDVLRIKQELEASRLETAKMIANRKVLQAALERQDNILRGLKASPYLRAIAQDTSVAFVPYDNLTKAQPGESVYSCWLEMVFCREVGVVKEIMPGEVSMKHPVRTTNLRGQMIQIDLKIPEAGKKDVLFVGRRPLFL